MLTFGGSNAIIFCTADAIQSTNRSKRGNRSGNMDKNKAQSATNSTAKNQTERPKRLELSAEEKSLVEQGKASMAMVRVLQADGTATAQPVLIGLNNRVSAEVLKGLKQGDQVVIADGSDTSNDAAKRSNRAGAGQMRI